jgi:hypothetical protein
MHDDVLIAHVPHRFFGTENLLHEGYELGCAFYNQVGHHLLVTSWNVSH